ncbi:hypothetical protein [Solirubrobacter pauli]|uniref:hypothetical protein n=1 Tax=Solirubrobacter pauli TaxID=166793 RepID=UPI000EB01745|nr:hypothetical protein [Solirubrobacter pauli]
MRTLADGLTTYQRGFQAAIASARSDMTRAVADFQVATARSQASFDRAAREAAAREAELARCTERCEDLARAHARAVVHRDECRRHRDRHKQALAKVERAAEDLLATIQAVEGAAGQTIPRGRKHIQEYATILDQYLQRSAS